MSIEAIKDVMLDEQALDQIQSARGAAGAEDVRQACAALSAAYLQASTALTMTGIYDRFPVMGFDEQANDLLSRWQQDVRFVVESTIDDAYMEFAEAVRAANMAAAGAAVTRTANVAGGMDAARADDEFCAALGAVADAAAMAEGLARGWRSLENGTRAVESELSALGDYRLDGVADRLGDVADAFDAVDASAARQAVDGARAALAEGAGARGGRVIDLDGRRRKGREDGNGHGDRGSDRRGREGTGRPGGGGVR